MDSSYVISLNDVKRGILWVFQPRDGRGVLDDLVFDTELEARAAQQGYRLANGYDPETGEKEQ